MTSDPVAPADLANPPLLHAHLQDLQRQMDYQAGGGRTLVMNVEYRLLEQMMRATKALMLIAGSQGATGAHASTFKTEARIALGWPLNSSSRPVPPTQGREADPAGMRDAPGGQGGE